eukprot:CAMPEP_0180437990 /NCGR_PEP_ID=MMETSP1036_2-20121128/11834_1 /TAXON_ID=632150 /ORGANISM="Azadinium spinosum, Strain 3D9" /LENGTH=80 /DNA_ID=CAMNT_0022444069 /DNA_START=700 /DNA_END=939 /DNA_ORIENTATION=+
MASSSLSLRNISNTASPDSAGNDEYPCSVSVSTASLVATVLARLPVATAALDADLARLLVAIAALDAPLPRLLDAFARLD